MAPEVIQERAEVRARVNNQEKDCLWGNGGDHRRTTFVFDDGGGDRPARGCLSNAFNRGNDGGSQRSQVFSVEVARGPRVYQESIASQNHHRLDTFALSKGPNEVVYGGQGAVSAVLFVRSLIGDEVKSSEQSLEVPQVRRLLFAVIINSLSRLFGQSAARRMLVLLGATAAIGTAACDDPFAPRATAQVRTDSFIVYSVSQTPVNVPAAFNIVFFTPLRLEPTYGFDLVFDIDQAGKVVLIPVRLVGGAVTAARHVGLQKINVPYDDVKSAPSSGYNPDTTLSLSVGEGAIVELQTQVCEFQSSQLVYAKLQIKAIDPVARTIVFRMTYDPNCGFKSFLPGVPTS